VHIQRINHASDAAAFVGTNISHNGVTGTVQHMTIRGGIPWLNVWQANGEWGEINFLDYLYDRSQGNTVNVNSSNTTGSPNPNAPPPIPGLTSANQTMLMGLDNFFEAGNIVGFEMRGNRTYFVFGYTNNNNEAVRTGSHHVANVGQVITLAGLKNSTVYHGGEMRVIEDVSIGSNGGLDIKFENMSNRVSATTFLNGWNAFTTTRDAIVNAGTYFSGEVTGVEVRGGVHYLNFRNIPNARVNSISDVVEAAGLANTNVQFSAVNPPHSNATFRVASIEMRNGEPYLRLVGANVSAGVQEVSLADFRAFQPANAGGGDS